MSGDLLSKDSVKHHILQPLLSHTTDKAEVLLLHNSTTLTLSSKKEYFRNMEADAKEEDAGRGGSPCILKESESTAALSWGLY